MLNYFSIVFSFHFFDDNHYYWQNHSTNVSIKNMDDYNLTLFFLHVYHHHFVLIFINSEKVKRRKKNGIDFMVNVPVMRFIISDYVTVDFLVNMKEKVLLMHHFTLIESKLLVNKEKEKEKNYLIKNRIIYLFFHVDQ